ncbi:hypothetical protein [Micromonospora halophytica]|uniref:Uncharacterized protein n=1 Tax=Micromonospora halophytica TaxID=47864 RepID=A0A1C5H126_9ACTN|nr:hypothetical protein [Micromonospora halophytica]SCG39688.1 hypothetical protein GA0070560_102444 [Micromonospora halophytica]
MSSYRDPILHGDVHPSEEEMDPTGVGLEPEDAPSAAYPTTAPTPAPTPEPEPPAPGPKPAPRAGDRRAGRPAWMAMVDFMSATWWRRGRPDTAMPLTWCPA